MSRLLVFLGSIVALAGGVCSVMLDARSQPGPPARSPVLVELFTSEGCSSCPPADDILARLVAEQPVEGAEVIALGFHVDYWNRLGWRDRFSSLEYTARQQDYAGSRQAARVYTPQAIVDGVHKFVGSDARTAYQSIVAAAATPKLTVTITLAATPGKGRVPVTIEVLPAPDRQESGDILLALTEDGLFSDVKRGENANRRLSHAAVVRALDEVGRVDARQGTTVTREVRVDPAWQREAVKIVVFVQDRRTRRILGVASRPLA